MSETRTLDEKATKIARARQQRGIDRLRAYFGWNEDEARIIAAMRTADFPSDERSHRRKRTKTQRIARRANRHS